MSNEEKKETAHSSPKHFDRKIIIGSKKKRILRQFILLLFLLSSSVIFTLQSKQFQKFLIKKVGGELLRLTGIELELTDFELSLFPPQIRARQINLMDLKSGSFEIELLGVDLAFNVIPMFSGQSIFNKISLAKANIRLRESAENTEPLKIDLPWLKKWALSTRKIKVQVNDIACTLYSTPNSSQLDITIAQLSNQHGSSLASGASNFSLSNSQLKIHEDSKLAGTLKIPNMDVSFNGRILRIPIFQYFVNDRAGEFAAMLVPVGGTLSANFQGSLPVEIFHLFKTDLGSLAGQVNFHSKATIDFSKNVLRKSSLKIDYHAVGLWEMAFGNGQFHLDYDRNLLRISGVAKPTQEGGIAIETQINFKEKKIPFDGKVSIDQISLKKFLNALDLDVSVIDILVDGRTNIKGTLSPFFLSASPSFNCQNIEVFISPTQTIRVSEAGLSTDLSLNAAGLQLTQTTVYTGTNRITAKAQFDFASSMAASVSAVSPDWEIAITTSSSPIIGFL